MAFAPFQTSLSEFEQESINKSLQSSQQQAQNVSQQEALSEGQATSETFRGPEFQEELARSRGLSENFPTDILQFLAPLSERFKQLEGSRRENLIDTFRRTGGLKSSSAGRRFTEFERDSGLNEILGQVSAAQSFFNPLAALQQNRLAVAGTPLSRSQSSNRSLSSGFASGSSAGSSAGSSLGSSSGGGSTAGFGFPPPLPAAPRPVSGPSPSPGIAALAPTAGVGVIQGSGATPSTQSGTSPIFFDPSGGVDFTKFGSVAPPQFEAGFGDPGEFGFDF